MRFYVLEEDLRSKQYATDIYGCCERYGDAPNCPNCGATCDSLEWLPPYKIEITRRGKEFGDIICQPGGTLFVTEAFRLAWLESHLRGLDSFDPVEIVRVKPRSAVAQLPFYWHALAKRSETAINISRSTLARVIGDPIVCNYCSPGYDAIAGFEIDQSTWTGEDIFRPRNKVGSVIVTEPFVAMVKKYQLTHAVLIPTEKYIYDPMHLLIPHAGAKV